VEGGGGGGGGGCEGWGGGGEVRLEPVLILEMVFVFEYVSNEEGGLGRWNTGFRSRSL